MRIEIENITPIVPTGVDRSVFERAAAQAIAENEAEIVEWSDKEAAIAEIGGSPDYRAWLATRSLDYIAGELVADRLAWSVPVTLACAPLEEQADDIDFVVKAKRNNP